MRKTPRDGQSLNHHHLLCVWSDSGPFVKGDGVATLMSAVFLALGMSNSLRILADSLAISAFIRSM
jgi:hypothetical protein